MGIYHHPDEPAIVPDAFLSLGVERFYDEELHPSYVLWDENVMPQFVNNINTYYIFEMLPSILSITIPSTIS
jgi:hypothetical protein